MNNIWIYLIIGLVIIYLMRNTEKLDQTPEITPEQLDNLRKIVRGEGGKIPRERHLRDHLIHLIGEELRKLSSRSPRRNNLMVLRENLYD